MGHTCGKHLFIVIGLVFVVHCQRAKADWQYTRWGFTTKEAQAASNGKLRKCSPMVCRAHVTGTSAAQLYGEYDDGTFTFTVFALFERWSGRLSSIELRLWQVDETEQLMKVFLEKLGEPKRTSRGAILETLIWQNPSDQITLLSVRDRRPLTSVTYRPANAP